jgi:site-specific DNA-methyltransferase (adenine-specific)
MKVTDKITITNEDNMLLMARYPDNYFDLAIVDPPYGIDVDNREDHGKKRSKKSASKSKDYAKKGWDSEVPKEEYFKELFRVSKNQIIWGVNYYPYNFLNGGRIFWDKGTAEGFTSGDGELAYCSKTNTIRKVSIVWNGMIQHDMKNKETRIHPTQKPVALYKWILDKYAKENDKILDTHLGSGSIAIACHDYGFELTACELDKEYYDKAIQRIVNHTNQTKLF